MNKSNKHNEDFSYLDKENPEMEHYVDRSMEIADRIHSILNAKKLNQKDLAERLGKKEAEVSKWLNGVHNFTIKTISKIENALGESIIVPVNGEEFSNYKKGASMPVIREIIVDSPNVLASSKYSIQYFIGAGLNNTVLRNVGEMETAWLSLLEFNKGKEDKPEDFEYSTEIE